MQLIVSTKEEVRDQDTMLDDISLSKVMTRKYGNLI
jgi:hypothetical protein